MTSILNTTREYPRMNVWCKFDDSTPNLWGVIVRKSRNVLEFWVKMAKMTLKVQVNDPYFKYQPRVSPWCMFGAYLAIPDQICDELSCRQGKVYGQTDGQTDRCRQWQYPSGLKGKGVKTTKETNTCRHRSRHKWSNTDFIHSFLYLNILNAHSNDETNNWK